MVKKLNRIVHQLRHLLPDHIMLLGRVYRKSDFSVFVPLADVFGQDIYRLYLHDKTVGSVRAIIDMLPEDTMSQDSMYGLALGLTEFFNFQRGDIARMNPRIISSLSGQPVATVCPICHHPSLTIYANYVAPVLDSVTGETIIDESLCISHLGCANYAAGRQDLLVARNELAMSPCFSYDVYNLHCPVKLANRLAIGNETILSYGLRRWANFFAGMCRATQEAL